MLEVHFSGLYAWLKEPLSLRTREDARQTELIRQAWADSGKVYGYRKLTDDLRDQGERISENRVARLASMAGTKLEFEPTTGRVSQKGKVGFAHGIKIILTVSDQILPKEQIFLLFIEVV